PERRDREARRVEPVGLSDFRFRLLARKVDAREVDVEVGGRLRDVTGTKVHRGLPPPEAALDLHSHLLRYEADLALVVQDPLRRAKHRDAEERGGKKTSHRGNMRDNMPSRTIH